MSKPEFLTNRPGELVADGIRGYLGFLRENRKHPYDLAIATAYFNLGGYQLLADELDHPRTSGSCSAPSHRYRSGECGAWAKSVANARS